MNDGHSGKACLWLYQSCNISCSSLTCCLAVRDTMPAVSTWNVYECDVGLREAPRSVTLHAVTIHPRMDFAVLLSQVQGLRSLRGSQEIPWERTREGAVRADKMSSLEIILKGKRKIITPHTVPLDIWFTAKWMKFWIFSVLHGSCGNCSVCFNLVVMYHPPPLHKQSCLMLMSIGAVCGLVSGIKAEEGLITSFREPWLRGQS